MLPEFSRRAIEAWAGGLVRHLGGFIWQWTGRLVLVAVYFLAAALIVQIVVRVLHFVRYKTRWDFGLGILRREGSAVFFSLVQGMITYAVFIVTTLLVLRRVFQVDTAALVTASGIVGLAIGFGTQGLVRDFMSGLFLILDGSLRPGDVVDIGGQSGVVQAVSLRTTTLLDAQGEVRYLPNGSIGAIVNYRGKGLEAVVAVFVPEGTYRSEEDAREQVAPAVEGLRKAMPFFEDDWAAEVRSVPGTGAEILQLSFRVLPARRALIEQVLVPVLRDALARAGVKVHQDRVVVYYREPGGGRREAAGRREAFWRRGISGRPDAPGPREKSESSHKP